MFLKLSIVINIQVLFKMIFMILKIKMYWKFLLQAKNKPNEILPPEYTTDTTATVHKKLNTLTSNE